MEEEILEKAAAVNPEIWGTRKGLDLIGIIVVALSSFAIFDLVLMAGIYINVGELPDIFGTLATIALSALAGVIGGAYANSKS